ncbi:MAG: OadG family protein [Christensenellales bacterium]|jgi:sodium pump decarboxylase gamma subunit
MSILAIGFKEIISLGSLTTLLGMGVTFIILCILVGVLVLLSKTVSIKGKQPQEMPENAPIAEPIIENGLNDKNNSEIAAILAAVYTLMEQEEDLPKADFIVKSIKRIK